MNTNAIWFRLFRIRRRLMSSRTTMIFTTMTSVLFLMLLMKTIGSNGGDVDVDVDVDKRPVVGGSTSGKVNVDGISKVDSASVAGGVGVGVGVGGGVGDAEGEGEGEEEEKHKHQQQKQIKQQQQSFQLNPGDDDGGDDGDVAETYEIFNRGKAQLDARFRENATLYMFATDADLELVLKSVANFEKRFNYRYNYDWVLLTPPDQPQPQPQQEKEKEPEQGQDQGEDVSGISNDSDSDSDNDSVVDVTVDDDDGIGSRQKTLYSKGFKEKVANLCSGKVTFGTIPSNYWNSYDDIFEIDEKKLLNCMNRLSSEQVSFPDSMFLRMKFRFHAGFLPRMKVMNDYKFYWRVEPDAMLDCDQERDPFGVMQTRGKKYGFNMALSEDKKTVRSLWKMTMKFFEILNPDFKETENSALNFVQYDRTSKKSFDAHFNLCRYWTESEIVELDFLRSLPYTKFFNYLDETGNFFYERWSDGIVRTVAVSFMVGADQIQYFDNTGYNLANPYVNLWNLKNNPGYGGTQSCPSDHQLRRWLHCQCNKRSDVTFRPWSCVPTFFRGLDLPFPEGHDDHDWTQW
ncbi:unnamed protein product [Ambrosiozyma monospora]|uniref:Unnamed protein product n=1 Tax=Ambrosiozyma monospora TaxID=43982 RepID=A0A9W6YSV0_AMBMO|nr:unnamed protein product [Ambrosiozyma monospora]